VVRYTNWVRRLNPTGQFSMDLCMLKKVLAKRVLESSAIVAISSARFKAAERPG
jgi:hypothetical protein